LQDIINVHMYCLTKNQSWMDRKILWGRNYLKILNALINFTRIDIVWWVRQLPRIWLGWTWN
jgi:hypothetical protein